MRFVSLLLLVGVTACGGGSTTTSRALQGSTLDIEGYVTDISDHIDGTPILEPDDLPTYVRVYSYETGTSVPIDTATASLDGNGAFQATVDIGDEYRLDLLDALQRPSAAGLVTAMGTDGSTSYAAYLTGLAHPGAEHTDMYVLVPELETLTITGTLSPDDPGGPAIRRIRYGVIEDGFWRTDTTLSVTPGMQGQVSISLSVPLFDPGCGYVGLIAQDQSGDDVPSGFSGSASTPTTTYTVESATPAGSIFFDAQCAGGFDVATWCKKEKLNTLYLKKRGKTTGATGGNSIWCIPCPTGGAVPAGGNVPTTQKVIESPTVNCDAHAGISAANGDVYIECQRFYNDDSPSLQERKKDVPNTPTRRSGVTYNFTAFEAPAAQATGKSVFDYQWYQRVKSSITYTTAGGGGTGTGTDGKYVWDDGGDPEHVYPHQTLGHSSAGAGADNNLNGMQDAPGLGVPTSAAEAQQLACDVGITGDDKTNWTSITMTTEFQTILICCAEDPPVIIAVYSWSTTVTITNNGDGTYSSSVSTTSGGPQEQLNEDGTPKAPTDAEWEMPDC